MPDAPTTASGAAPTSLRVCATAEVSVGAKLSLPTSSMPCFLAAFSTSTQKVSPSALLKPMNASFFTPWAAAWRAMPSAISESECGVLNTQRRLSSIGSIRRAEDASVMTGVAPAATVSSIAIVLGVVLEPMIRSTLFSEISLCELLTARVGSEASSSTTYSTFAPPISAGNRLTVLRSGMPSEACGPVADKVAPIFTCACAGAAPRQAGRPSARASGRRSGCNVGSYAISFGVGGFVFRMCRPLRRVRVQAGMPPCVENAPLQNTSAPASSSYRCRRRTWPIRMA